MIIAYSHCIAHGYDLAYGLEQQKLAVDSGVWPLYRFDPRRVEAGENPLQFESGEPNVSVRQYVSNETRFRMVEQQNPERFRHLIEASQRGTRRRFELYRQLAEMNLSEASGNDGKN
jgi:pyruvate-ferredoxin/flavodoxin oxidoreductase